MKVIVTGTTGMVGEGVLMECLQDPQITEVLSLSRRPTGRTHPKLREILHPDFFDITPIAPQLVGYDACYFCLGVTSIGKSEEEYTKHTYTLTLHVAGILSSQNPQMTFCYVSGAGTDSTEKGKTMWARVKGKTENDLMKLPFKQVFAFRPAFMKATPGQMHLLSWYKYMAWMYPIGRALYPKGFCKLSQVARAMINVTQKGYFKQIIDVKDMIALAGA